MRNLASYDDENRPDCAWSTGHMIPLHMEGVIVERLHVEARVIRGGNYGEWHIDEIRIVPNEILPDEVACPRHLQARIETMLKDGETDRKQLEQVAERLWS